MIKSKAWKIEKWWNIIPKNQTPKGVIGENIDYIKNIIKKMRVKIKIKKTRASKKIKLKKTKLQQKEKKSKEWGKNYKKKNINVD